MQSFELEGSVNKQVIGGMCTRMGVRRKKRFRVRHCYCLNDMDTYITVHGTHTCSTRFTVRLDWKRKKLWCKIMFILLLEKTQLFQLAAGLAWNLVNVCAQDKILFFLTLPYLFSPLANHQCCWHLNVRRPLQARRQTPPSSTDKTKHVWGVALATLWCPDCLPCHTESVTLFFSPRTGVRRPHSPLVTWPLPLSSCLS